MDDSRIELVARALCEAEGKDPDETQQGDRLPQVAGKVSTLDYEDVPNWRYKRYGYAAEAKKFVMAFDILNNSKS